MNLQNVAKITIPDGEVKNIHDKNGKILWGKVSYAAKYYGNSSQNGTPSPSSPVEIRTATGENTVYVCGKNLFDINNNSAAIHSNVETSGSIISNSTIRITNIAAGAYRYYFIPLPNTQAVLGKTITLSAKASFSGATSAQMRFMWASDGWYTTSLGSAVNFSSDGTYTCTVNVPDSIPSGSTRLCVGLYSSGTTSSPLNSYIDYSDIQVEFGSIRSSYEPYQSQDYLLNLGKNLLTFGSSNISGDKNGVVYSYNAATQEWTFNGTATAQTDIQYPSGTGIDMRLSSGVRYTTTAFYQSGTISGGSIRLFQQDSVHGWQGVSVGISSAANSSEGYTPSANLLLNESHLIRIANGTALSNFKIKYQTERGSVATSYAPYFPPIELCKIGDYQDYFYKSGSKWYKHSECGVAHLPNDLSSVGTSETNTTGIMRFGIGITNSSNVFRASSSSNIYPVLCSILPAGTRGNAYAREEVVSYGTNGTNNYKDFSVYISACDTMTTTQFESWLRSNPIDIAYILATPTDTEITNTSIIAQLDTVNNFAMRNGYNLNASGGLPVIISRTAT